MKHASILIAAAAAALMWATAASAQFVQPGGGQFPPPVPPPPPLPQPKIEVPVIPQMDAPARPNYAPAPRSSFGERVTKCLDAAAAGGLGPNERAAYSRSCANQ